MPVDPMYREAVELLSQWFAQAQALTLQEPAAAALATSDAQGRPSVRIVLIRAIDEQGLVFFTNSLSRKGTQMKSNPHAALVFYWDALGRQIRVEGRVEIVNSEQSDTYFHQRSRLSQLGAWASRQSETLDARSTLEQRLAEYEQQFAGREVSRPPHWFGYRVVPHRIEFWTNREGRLHDRTLYLGSEVGWARSLLFP